MTKYEFVCAMAVPHLSKLSLQEACGFKYYIMPCRGNNDHNTLTPLSDKVYEEADRIIGNAGILVTHSKALFDRNVRRPFLTAIMDHLRSCFPSSNLLEKLSPVFPHTLPVDLPEQIGVYGEEKLKLLLDHYHGTPLEVDGQKAIQEWELLRPILVQQQCTTLADVVSYMMTLRVNSFQL